MQNYDVVQETDCHCKGKRVRVPGPEGRESFVFHSETKRVNLWHYRVIMRVLGGLCPSSLWQLNRQRTTIKYQNRFDRHQKSKEPEMVQHWCHWQCGPSNFSVLKEIKWARQGNDSSTIEGCRIG